MEGAKAVGSIVRGVKWGSLEKKKGDMSGAELRAFYRARSEVFASFHEINGVLDFVYIELRGELGRIPSLKNWRMPGKHFVNPDVMSRIRVMDELFEKSCRPPKSFGDKPVHMTLICGERKGSFDLVGCVETIQDWLEPSTKKVGRKGSVRGWGVGLVDNDSQITPMPIHSWQTGIKHDHSTIILRPWEKMKEHVLETTASAYLLASNNT